MTSILNMTACQDGAGRRERVTSYKVASEIDVASPYYCIPPFVIKLIQTCKTVHLNVLKSSNILDYYDIYTLMGTVSS